MIASGEKLGRYRILSHLGAEGTGEVYLAEDSHLERKAALKVLPSDVASNQERMRRFVQEAKSASALNHPNIITIYEIAEFDKTHYIATEFIEGEILREKLSRERLKIEEALDIAVQTVKGKQPAMLSPQFRKVSRCNFRIMFAAFRRNSKKSSVNVCGKMPMNVTRTSGIGRSI